MDFWVYYWVSAVVYFIASIIFVRVSDTFDMEETEEVFGAFFMVGFCSIAGPIFFPIFVTLFIPIRLLIFLMGGPLLPKSLQRAVENLNDFYVDWVDKYNRRSEEK